MQKKPLQIGPAQIGPAQIKPAGPRAVLVEVEDPGQAVDLAGWVCGRVETEEVVPGARTVLLDGLAPGWSLGGLVAVLADWVPGPIPRDGPLIEILVRYDGSDLSFVADRWGMSVERAVETHSGTVFVAAFSGFAPGFAYLAGLPPSLAVPRLESPRARLAAGSVGLADVWCGIYPGESPGGWRIIGHTETCLWDVDRSPPALLAPGTRARFVPG